MGKDPNHTLTACAECDLLMRRPAPTKSREARCPRCGHRDRASRYFSPQSSLALSLTALIIAIPANIYPQMSFSLLSRPNTYTLTEGALELFHSGFWGVGGVILLCTVIAPIVVLLCIFMISLLWSLRRAWRLTGHLLKIFHYATNWALLDVYLLSMIVAMVKLRDMGAFELSAGFFCFVLMLILATASTLSFNHEACWDAIERHQHAGR